jgi:hypothetical protein
MAFDSSWTASVQRRLPVRVRFRRAFVAIGVSLPLLLTACERDRSRGEAPPYTTDIFLVEITEENGRLVPGPPVNLTDREGYDNQPAFLPDGGALLYASRVDEQIEVYEVDLADGAARRRTQTPEREYQPTPLPRGDGFSVVRVELDGTQRLWRFDRQGGNPALILESPDNLRYHAWADPETIVLVDVDLRPNLLLVNVKDGSVRHLLEDVGRSLQPVPGRRAVSFVHMVGEEEWWIKELDLETGLIRSHVITRPGSEDHAWTPSGLLLMGQGSRLFQWRPAPGADWNDWREVADLAEYGIDHVTRIAVSPDGSRLALVSRHIEVP